MQQSVNKHIFEPIAVIGVGALYPGSTNADGFWNDILNGKDLITDVPPSHWLIDDYYDPNLKAIDKTYCKRGAFLKDYAFDPIEYGIPPNIIPATDTSQLLALIVAKETLHDTKQYQFQGVDLSRVSVILGAGSLEALQFVISRMQRPVWKKALQEFGLSSADTELICDKIANSYVPWQEATFPGLLGNVVAGRVANRFNLGGTNCVVDAACATSLAALSMATSELQLGSADMVITGGIDTLNDINMFMCFSKVQALSLDGDCRPFSNKADGTILGEGLGMLALKRLSDAERDGNPIYALIRGVGTSSDGRSKSIYAPLASGQSKAILRAYEMAGYPLDTVEMIEAHGTGTKAGDHAEFHGLNIAFSEMKNTKKQFCALGSVKSQIGHTKAAAGTAGLFKLIMALHHKTFPPTIKVDQPNPSLDWKNSPFYLNTEARPWINGHHPRRGGVSSFGFGGSNFHVTAEEYTGKQKAERLRTCPTELIILTADSPQNLIILGQQILEEITESTLSLSYLPYRLQKNFNVEHLSRLAIVAKEKEDLREKLLSAIATIQVSPLQTFSWVNGIYYGQACNPGKVAFLFSGQGSQYINMGANLAMSFMQAMQVWEKAAQYDFNDNKRLHEVVFPAPVFDQAEQTLLDQQLTATEWAQPALAITSLAQLKLMQILQIDADCAAGHSFGELPALHAAGVFDEAQLLAAAHQRGILMRQVGTKQGAMISVQHASNVVLDLLKKWQLPLTPANFNSPKQIVLSGGEEAIADFEKHLKEERITCQILPVSTAFHSTFVANACKPFAKFLESIPFKSPKIPVYANTTAKPYPNKPGQIKETLAEQLAKPVLFQQQIEAMYQAGIRTFIEIGPKAILSGLVKQCLENKEYYAISLDRKNEHGVTGLWHALGQLTAIGLNPLFTALWDEYRIPLAPLLNKNNQHTLLINGTNFGKPYPSPASLESPPNKQPSLPKSTTLNTLHAEKKLIRHDLMEKKNMSENNQTSLISMYQELQKQLVDAHNTYQKAMAESHIAFLNSVTNLAYHVTNNQSNEKPSFVPPLSLPKIVTAPPSSPVAMSHEAPAIQQETPLNLHTRSNPPSPLAISKPVLPTIPLSMTTESHLSQTAPIILQTVLTEQTATAEVTKNNFSHLKELLLNIVVEKTGYPAEMLNMDMAIEADLGIDSIKRVEILSTLAERVPNLPTVAPDELAELRTLGDIAAYMEQRLDNNSQATGTA